MSEIAVRFSGVSKRFRLGPAHDSVGDLLASGVARLLGRRREPRSMFWALRKVSFSVGRGEAVGIIGPNGAGKSTALKLLAGILRADEGSVEVAGRLAALIEVGAGFHGDLTGQENVFLNGAIMGMSRREIRGKLDAIIAFAGIERFVHMPVKRYSSGMYARLGFSIASHVDPEILLVDEVLSVGDAVFRLRCLDRMRELVRGGTTLIFVTHNLEQMQSICPRAIVLERGGVMFEGPAREAVGQYLDAMSRSYAKRPTDVTDDAPNGAAVVELQNLRFLGENGDEVVWVRPCEPIRLELTFRVREPISRPRLGVRQLVVELNLRAAVNENVLSFNSGRDDLTFCADAGVHRVTLRLPAIPLAGGHYFWNVRIWDADTGRTELDTPLRYPMVIDDGGRATGILALQHEWTFETQPEASATSPEFAVTPTASEAIQMASGEAPMPAGAKRTESDATTRAIPVVPASPAAPASVHAGDEPPGGGGES